MNGDDKDVEQRDAKDGEPVAHLIGSMKDKVQVKGDIFSTGIKWDAES
jgi:hypothetical protein